MEQNAPGRSFLKVTGILEIIFAVFSAVSIAGTVLIYTQLTAGSLPDETVALYEQLGLDASTMLTSIIISVVGTILFLAAGILGVANARKVEKAGICVLLGILLVAYEVINFAMSAVSSGVTGLVVVSTLLSLIIPLLYLWGGLKNKEAAESGGPAA